MAGNQKTKDMVLAVAKLAKAVDKAYEDGKISMADSIAFIQAVPALVKGAVGVMEIPAEFKDLDSSEQDEIIALWKTELDLQNDGAERAAEIGFEVLVKLLKLLAELKK